MIVLLSPSKTLDYTSTLPALKHTQPALLDEASILIRELRQYSPVMIARLMELSDKLSMLNYERYQSFKTPFTPANARCALLAFKGDVYEPLQLSEYTAKDYMFAQEHVRILSGLYGLLRPLDLMQPYRLEMGTPLKTGRGKNLYSFWGNLITDEINEAIKSQKNKVVVNLASVEYFQSVKPERLNGRLLTVAFKEKHKGGLKVIGLMAKRARGMMTNYVIRNHIDRIDDLKAFDDGGYRFQSGLSDDSQWVFTR